MKITKKCSTGSLRILTLTTGPGATLDPVHEDSGCYWVQGKAGSGKRTLMKFIAASEKTPEALHEWTGPRQLITRSHFFWHAGTELQKNVQGLFRTLLYQIFTQRRDLISQVFPGRYRTATSK